ncbi:hypothetical protein [Phenylobacterium sp.]|uniref:hypothetical protein n=1 Tax=Phenylobacterium sp. TaxID=1871053 RepID=UPI0035B44C35
MPSYQGELDGLCGAYAIANALEQCGLGKHHETFFQIACAAASERGPQHIWEGTSFSILRRMLAACLRSPSNRAGIRASYPFYRETPPSNAAYWERFDKQFENDRALCGIVGLIKPTPHWLVIAPDGRRLIFTNSDPSGLYQRKNRAAVFAGTRRKRPGQWLLDRRELVVLSA